MIAGGIASLLLFRPPAMLATENFSQVMVRLEQGGYLLLQGSGRNFTVKQWRESLPEPYHGTIFSRHLPKGVKCDAMACTIRGAEGLQLVWVKEADALAEYCTEAEGKILMTPFGVKPSACSAPAQLLVPASRYGESGKVYYTVKEKGQLLLKEQAATASQRLWSSSAD
jgi:hypothetical protein